MIADAKKWGLTFRRFFSAMQTFVCGRRRCNVSAVAVGLCSRSAVKVRFRFLRWVWLVASTIRGYGWGYWGYGGHLWHGIWYGTKSTKRYFGTNQDVRHEIESRNIFQMLVCFFCDANWMSMQELKIWKHWKIFHLMRYVLGKLWTHS